MTWAVLVVIGACTYGLRASMFVALGSRSVPEWLEGPLALVGPAAIAALLGSMLFTRDGAVSGAPLADAVAVVAAYVVVRRTQNVMAAMAVGLPVAWALAAVGF